MKLLFNINGNGRTTVLTVGEQKNLHEAEASLSYW